MPRATTACRHVDDDAAAAELLHDMWMLSTRPHGRTVHGSAWHVYSSDSEEQLSHIRHPRTARSWGAATCFRQ
eukprot:3562370-Prymnesium_polylepis.1